MSTKYKQRTILNTLSSTRLSSTSRDTGVATASCVGDAGASPSFLGVAPDRDPLRERKRRNDLRMLSLRDFLLERCSPLSVSAKIKAFSIRITQSPPSAETWKTFPNLPCQFFFAQTDILSQKKAYFRKHLFCKTETDYMCKTSCTRLSDW